MQTYRNFYKEIEEQNFDITYHEMLYKLYREHFKPHTLMYF